MTQLTEVQRKTVDAFMAARSWYKATPDMVEIILQVNEAQGVPFCETCSDWHTPDEQHSITDEAELLGHRGTCDVCGAEGSHEADCGEVNQ